MFFIFSFVNSSNFIIRLFIVLSSFNKMPSSSASMFENSLFASFIKFSKLFLCLNLKPLSASSTCCSKSFLYDFHFYQIPLHYFPTLTYYIYIKVHIHLCFQLYLLQMYLCCYIIYYKYLHLFFLLLF